MLERLTRNKILQKLCLCEIGKLTSKEVAQVVEWWGCSFAFPSEPSVGEAKEQSESTKNSSESSGSSSKSSSSLSESSSTESTEKSASEDNLSDSEDELPCRLKSRQLG